MKTAKEMFEDLGFKEVNVKENIIWYSNYGVHNNNIIKEIYRIRFHVMFNNYDYWCYDTKSNYIPIELHKAINKQIEELGWLQ